MKKILIIIICLFPTVIYAMADGAKSSILIDYDTGNILYENNSNEMLPPASMTKMMSLLIIMEKLETGIIHLDDEVYISGNAASMGGSQIYLKENTKMKLEDLLKSVCIASANDAITSLAEHVSGSTSEFVKLMNERALELGLTNTVFKNVHGLHEEGHYSSAHDMAYLAKELIKHEKILEYSSIYEDYITHSNGSSIWIVNTNKLLNHYEGLDGLKTGFTNQSGYCITATAKRGNLRLISVVMGEETNNQRNVDTMELLNYGFTNYKIDPILNTNSNIGMIDIKFGNIEKSKLRIINNINYLSKIEDNNSYSYEIKIDNDKAPLNKGDIVGKLILYVNGNKGDEYDLTINDNIKKGNILNYLYRNIMIFIKGYY